jgi:hypothetical protein
VRDRGGREWTDVRLHLPQKDSFMKLKKFITLAPVLVLPDDNFPFRLEADGSGIATGAVLSQMSMTMRGILSLFCPKCSTQWSGTMRSMTLRC